MRVTQLWVYPIKSCEGVRVETVEVGPRGVAGDRRLMVVDGTGEFITQRTQPKLALLRPTPTPAGLVLEAPGQRPRTLPDLGGAARRDVFVWKDHLAAWDVGDEAAAWICAMLGRDDFRLVAFDEAHERAAPEPAPPGATVRFADAFPLLVVSEASLSAAEGARPGAGDVRRYRPNLVVDGLRAFEEDELAGIRNETFDFSFVELCERCRIVDVDPSRGQDEKGTLSTLADLRPHRNAVIFGQYAVVRGSGRLSVGDSLAVIPGEVP